MKLLCLDRSLFLQFHTSLVILPSVLYVNNHRGWFEVGVQKEQNKLVVPIVENLTFIYFKLCLM